MKRETDINAEPEWVWWLGYLGILPFVVLSLLSVMNIDMGVDGSVFALRAYGGVILCFIGGYPVGIDVPT